MTVNFCFCVRTCTHGYQCRTTKLVSVKCTASSLNAETHPKNDTAVTFYAQNYRSYVAKIQLRKIIEFWKWSQSKAIISWNYSFFEFSHHETSFCLLRQPRYPVNVHELNRASFQLFSYLLWARNDEQPNVKKKNTFTGTLAAAKQLNLYPFLNFPFWEAICKRSKTRKTYRIQNILICWPTETK